MTGKMVEKQKRRNLLIRGGRIIDPGLGIDEIGSLLIAGGKIAWRGQGEATPPIADYDILTAEGLIVSPGFIDLHCHLRQPGYEEKETIASGSLAAARGGFTTVCAMPNTSPPPDSRETIEIIKQMTAGEGVIRVLPIGCITRGRQGETLADLAEMAAAGVVGCSDDGSPVMDSALMQQALELSRTLNLPIIDHCEDSALSGDGQVNENISRRLGLPGIPPAAEWLMVMRDIALAQLTGGWLHIAHVSAAASVEFIRHGKERGIKVTAEVTPHHLTLTEDAVTGFDANAKVNPPLRTQRDIQALIEGLNEGVIDIIATDHAPHTPAEKQSGFNSAPSGISGLETALGSLMGLVHEGKLTLTRLIACLTSEPARIIGEKHGRLGTLAVGAPAEITIFNPDCEWRVDPETFASKGKNTPLAGKTLRGRVMATVFNGEFVYKDDSLKVSQRKQKVRGQI